jgi:alpha-L-fucosidase
MAFDFHDGRNWFFKKRFGMFIHWGLYAIHGIHEQEQWRCRVPRGEYGRLLAQFNPRRFSPDAWLDLATEAGMEYLAFTTKHHDGFCLWDTAETELKVTRSPYGRDILAELSTACQRRDFPLCPYYSVVDWHHPSYPNQGRSHELDAPAPGDQPDLERYLAFLRAQVRELCTGYGPIHGFWWDMNVTEHRDPAINAMIRQLQPAAVINNRGFDDGDFGTPERDFDAAADAAPAFLRPTEACQSVGAQSWGYRRDEDYFSAEFLIRSLARALARGGNFLLNVGPDADGEIPAPAAALLRTIGAWHGRAKEAFADTAPAPEFSPDRDVFVTRRGNTLYVMPTAPLPAPRLILKGIVDLPQKATLLNTGKPIAVANGWLPQFHGHDAPFLQIADLHQAACRDTVPVIRLDFARPPVVAAAENKS